MDNQIKQERGSEELSAAIVENGYSELDCNPHIYWTKLFECQTLSKEEINKIAETTAKEKQIEINCDNCKRHHTKYCPNSSECMSLPDLPYFETDVIRLLEHDWTMHEKKIYELKAENERIRQNSVSHETFKAIMDEKDKEIKALKQAKEEFDEHYLNWQIDCARLETINDIEAIICCATERKREDGCQYIGSNNFEDMWNELDEYEEKLDVRK